MTENTSLTLKISTIATLLLAYLSFTTHWALSIMSKLEQHNSKIAQLEVCLNMTRDSITDLRDILLAIRANGTYLRPTQPKQRPTPQK